MSRDEQSDRVYSYTQNLVSVLNDPSRTRPHVEDFFARDWGPAFVHTATTDLVSRKTGSKALRKSASVLTKKDLVKYIQRWRDWRESTKCLHNSNSNQGSLNSQNAPLQNGPKNTPAIMEFPPSVDRMFFSDDFNLCSEETFQRVLNYFYVETETRRSPSPLTIVPDVTEKSATKLTDRNGNRAQLAVQITPSRLKCVEKRLSDNLDVIEDKIAEHVRRREGDFFCAMISLDSLMAELALGIRSVTATRQKCAILREVLVQPSCTSLGLHIRLRNMKLVAYRLQLMSRVHQAQPTVQLLLASNDFAGALDLIATAREVQSQDLDKVKSFRYLASQLDDIQKRIPQILSSISRNNIPKKLLYKSTTTTTPRMPQMETDRMSHNTNCESNALQEREKE